ncbi:MAG: ABC transporter ATP-binding protein [Burkholderiales bacterium]|jgi:branched-chain amino acid transport system ATP-binding protein|nr:ABC transporter ATP-binding protein [Burkholderiales bacterium]
MRFGGLVALSEVSLEVAAGEIVAVIGPNGAGKSTLFNVVTGLYRPTAGRVRVAGEEVTGRPTHQIVALGVARTFQSSRLFTGVSVLDNVIIGMHALSPPSVLQALLLWGRTRRELRLAAERAERILQSVGGNLYEQRYRLAEELAQADRRRLEVARALAGEPKLLLLDEPTAGMDDRDTDALIEDIRRIRRDRPQLAIVVVEHDMRLVAALPERVAVLDYGRKIAESVFDEIRLNPWVQEAYLGSTTIDD